VRHTPVCRGDRTSETRGTHVPAHESRVCLRAGASGEGLARRAKAIAKILQALRRRWSENEPASEQRPARAGAAPREGKALEGRSKDASGERRSGRGVTSVGSCSPRSVGGHGERRDFKRSRASREPAETVERGKNPEDGTDEGLAILVPRGRPRGRSRRRRGTRRSCVRGSKNLTRGGPARSWNGTAPS
jgi:hypothetical protein